MNTPIVVAVLLALLGPVGTGDRVQGPSVAAGPVVEQAAARPGSDTVPPAGAGAPEDAPPDGVSIEKLDIAIPPVTAPSDAVVPDQPLKAQADADVVVADQLVSATRVESEVVSTSGFQTLGVTWPLTADVGDLGGQVRTKTDGTWSAWMDLAQSDGGPDAGTADAANAVRGGTDSVAIGNADAVQLAFAATTTGGPEGLSLALIGSEEKPVPAGVGTAAATGKATIRNAAYTSRLSQAVTAPRVISRAEWGAPAQACTPDVASNLVGAVVHHTAGSNSYADVAQAMQQIRNDAAYHINTRGWCDIGYNFIVDKWGNIYEGRANSLNQPVVGAHAGGFNTGTVGVSMLGTYDALPSPATQQAVAQIIGWRLGAYGVDPRGSMSYYTTTGENSKFTDQTVTLPRVLGHRDVAYTACPGNGGYAALPNIREMAWDVSSSQVMSTLVRTPSNPTVYLVTSTTKYPIPNEATLQAYDALGPLGYVPQEFLNQKTTGGVLGRVILAADSSVYLVDGVNKYRFGSCALVATYGSSCASARLLDDSEIAAFRTGPALTTTVRVTSGRVYAMDAGLKREAFDAAALAGSGLAPATITITDAAVGFLPVGPPVLRAGTVLQSRSSGSRFLVDGGQLIPVVPGLFESTPLGTLPSGLMDSASLLAVPWTTDPNLGLFAHATSSSDTYLLLPGGRSRVLDTAALPARSTAVPQVYLDAFPAVADSASPILVKDNASPAVYKVDKGSRRPITSWDDAVRIAAVTGQGPAIDVMDVSVVKALPLGPDQAGPGTLVYGPGSAGVYVIDGYSRKIRVPNWDRVANLGASRLTQRSDAVLDAYVDAAAPLTNLVQCGTTRYLAAGGVLYPLGAGAQAHFTGVPVTALDPATCAVLQISTTEVGRFLRLDSGLIYYMENGAKRRISSYAQYIALGGNNHDWISVGPDAVATIPTGAAI